MIDHIKTRFHTLSRPKVRKSPYPMQMKYAKEYKEIWFITINFLYPVFLMISTHPIHIIILPLIL